MCKEAGGERDNPNRIYRHQYCSFQLKCAAFRYEKTPEVSRILEMVSFEVIIFSSKPGSKAAECIARHGQSPPKGTFQKQSDVIDVGANHKEQAAIHASNLLFVGSGS